MLKHNNYLLLLLLISIKWRKSNHEPRDLIIDFLDQREMKNKFKIDFYLKIEVKNIVKMCISTKTEVFSVSCLMSFF